MKNVIHLLVVLIFASCSCDSGFENIYRYDYNKFKNLKSSENACGELKMEPKTFYFDSKLTKKFVGMELKIEIQGKYYEAIFGSRVLVKDFTYCNENELLKIGSINFHIGDKINETAYLLSRKQSYDLSSFGEAHISVCCSNCKSSSYEIDLR